ncbi:unnamed protein product [Rangifer tarandus platyrhynchus]|uniref:Uncharacterized protein n=2 Tax=Rangifer tarandus platyrhynchus TaxID=3082113 RepID=A0ACB0F9T8_RANTA|nr:unnamed protein product [Rangifer tarandus platyrhynchus]CAI9709263.1 unnamed protein product [Rangifer tarandus platyrhynchus]
MKEELIQPVTLQQSEPGCAHCTGSDIRAVQAGGGDALKLPAARRVVSVLSPKPARGVSPETGPKGSEEREDKQEPGYTSGDASAGRSYARITHCGDRSRCLPSFRAPGRLGITELSSKGPSTVLSPAPRPHCEACTKTTEVALRTEVTSKTD